MNYILSIYPDFPMGDKITVSRERGLFVHPHTAVILLSSRSLDKNSVKQDGGFMFGVTMRPAITCPHGITPKKKCKVCELEYYRKWRKANPKKRREGFQKWVQENREKYLESNYKWAQANLEKVRANHRKWQKDNPEKVRAKTNAQRARRQNAEGKYTAAEWRALKAFYNFTCLRCGRREPEIKGNHILDTHISKTLPSCKKIVPFSLP